MSIKSSLTRERLWRVLPTWLALSLLGTGVVGFAHLAIQQQYRNGADDPQIEIAEDAATWLSAGRPISTVVPSNHVDMASSLAPFIIVLNSGCSVEAGNGYLNGRVPAPPAGSLLFAAKHGRNRFSWAPETGVREAAFAVPYKSESSSGYVVAARSLKEVERRESQLMLLTAIALVGVVAVSLLTALAISETVDSRGSRG